MPLLQKSEVKMKLNILPRLASRRVDDYGNQFQPSFCTTISSFSFHMSNRGLRGSGPTMTGWSLLPFVVKFVC